MVALIGLIIGLIIGLLWNFDIPTGLFIICVAMGILARLIR